MLEADIAAKRLASGAVLLRSVGIAASAGQVVALLGASGVGKTTVLRIILGLDRAFEGSVRIGAARVGAVFQEPRLLPWRTIGDNIRFVDPGRAIDIRAALDEVCLPATVETLYPRQVSLGMARRASVARALAVAPQLLVLDEPFASLDPATAGRIAARVMQAAAGRRRSRRGAARRGSGRFHGDADHRAGRPARDRGLHDRHTPGRVGFRSGARPGGVDRRLPVPLRFRAGRVAARFGAGLASRSNEGDEAFELFKPVRARRGRHRRHRPDHPADEGREPRARLGRRPRHPGRQAARRDPDAEDADGSRDGRRGSFRWPRPG